jgi:NAD(P) transhydrogenase subunit alpha
MTMLFVPKETTQDEARVAVTPDTIKSYKKRGLEVVVEAGAGLGSFVSDAQFEEAGATISKDPAAMFRLADVVLKLHPPAMREDLDAHEADLIKEGGVLISFLWPLTDPDLVKRLAERKVSAFAMDQVPRISRAQSMDALSSQSNIAGYKAVILAADALPKLFPMMMTAAGTIKPAKVVIIGAGVAGLQAIATAKRLGAVVEVSDIRPAVKEQVESLGGRFIEVKSDEALEDAGGYAKEVSDEFKKKQQAVLRQHIVAADVVITTALVPGKKAPVLVTADMVKEMRAGSVIVDLATEQGGNCELSEAGKVVEKEGVTLIGHRNLPALQPVDASAMYAKNIEMVIRHLFDKEGNMTLDFEDEITDGSFMCHDGAVRSEKVCELLGIDPPAKAKPEEAAASTDEAASPSTSASTDETSDKSK